MNRQPLSPRFPPCDQCLQRKVRCDKTLPLCYRCSDATIPCTREVIRRRPGRKKGSGAVIAKLRIPSTDERHHRLKDPPTSAPGRKFPKNFNDPKILGFEKQNTSGLPSNGQISLLPHHDDQPGQLTALQSQDFPSVLSTREASALQGIRSDSVGDLSTILLDLPNITRHIDLFYSKLYPIWPIIPETAFRKILNSPETLDHSQVCLILSICALSALHIPGSTAPVPQPRKVVAQQFINQCRQLRSTFDYIENATIITVQTSLFLSCAEVEYPRARSSWFLLRESIMLAQDLGFYDPANFSPNLSPNDILRIQRTLYLLSLVERGLTVLRNKPFAIVKFDSPPPSRFSDEDPRILNGLQTLSQLFNLLDNSFLDNWVGNSEVSSITGASPSSLASMSTPAVGDILIAQQTLASMVLKPQDFTDVQKADIFITQQWLRLVFWQASMRQGLLSSKSAESVLRYDFPCEVARSLCLVLAEIDREAIFVHGMAIFERIFEVAYSFIDSLSLSDSISSGSEELEVLFKVLRESPNSHSTYIQILQAKVDGHIGGDD